ncbi:hypothetical protein [Salinigranum marinum]|uniref:hypothetical protein n=1 Tax=Salinigranum marinum TaxID=1515595 RepID=UPI002989F9C8|nr:hypothetical protein [Salinigranum marinum]
MSPTGRGSYSPPITALTQRVPPVLLAEYEHDVLVNVTPCRSRERCVAERLDALEVEAGRPARAPVLAAHPVRPALRRSVGTGIRSSPPPGAATAGTD